MMLRLDHVQLAIPAGAEALCRAFYVGVLGMKRDREAAGARGSRRTLAPERRGPDPPRRRGGVPSRRAKRIRPSPSPISTASRRRLAQAGHAAIWDEAIPGRRFFAARPLGNRIEFMEDGARW